MSQFAILTFAARKRSRRTCGSSKCGWLNPTGMEPKKPYRSINPRSSTALCKYEPRLLSRSTTILKPSSKTCCSIVCRTFAGAIAFSVSLFGVRFRVEGVSAGTGALLIRDRNCDLTRGQLGTRTDDGLLACLGKRAGCIYPNHYPEAAVRVFRRANPARERSRACPRCARCRRNDGRFAFARSGRNNLRLREFHQLVCPVRAAIAHKNRSR